MKIDRSNFEEYMLLALDKELDAASLQELSLFLEGNPDLKCDAEMLKATLLPTEDTIIYPDTSALQLIPQMDEIKEKLLSYIDHELTQEEEAITLSLVNMAPTVSKELELFRNAKLTEDLTITYPWKDQLYRKENNTIPFYILRIAAAVIILIGFSWIWFSNTSQNIPDLTKNQINSLSTLDTNKKSNSKNNATETISPTDKTSKLEIAQAAPYNYPKKNEASVLKKQPSTDLQKIIVPAVLPSPEILAPSNEIAISIVPTENTIPVPVNSMAVSETLASPITEITFIETDELEGNDSPTQILITDTNKRNKTRSLLRKIVRYSNRAAELITASTHELKNIQVASFEIGLK